MSKFKVYDVVRYKNHTKTNSAIRVTKVFERNDKQYFEGYSIDFENRSFSLRSDHYELHPGYHRAEEWSDWEEVALSYRHSKYWEGCQFVKRQSHLFEGTSFKGPGKVEFKIRLDNKPKPVKVSELKGTVEFKDGKPDWSTYKEEEEDK